MMSRYAGRHLLVDAPTFTYEYQNDHRNRAIAHLLRSSGALKGRIDDVLHLYYQHCSLLVNAVELAAMGATFANNGVHPLTGERILTADYVRDVLTIMYSCGMYDSSGEWAYTVGLPAKSGVSGGVIAVLPGQFGICVYSPPVDERGNSVRGIRVCEDLSRDTGMHIFESLPAEGAVLDRIEEVAHPSPALPDTSHHLGDATVHARDLELGGHAPE